MSHPSDQLVSVVVKDGFSSFLFPDGSIQDVPQAVLLRSALLVRTLSDADHDGVFSFIVPHGFLHSWFQWVALASCSEHHPAAAVVSAPLLLQFLKAADFLDDSESVNILCKLTAALLFGTDVDDRQDPVVLEELPETLQISILAASPQPLSEHILMLPHHLHMVALLAAYPSITSQNSLHIANCDALSYTAPAFLRLLGSLSCLEHLSIMGKDMVCADVKTMAPHIGKLKTLKHLALEDCMHHPEGPEALAFILFNLRDLTHLSLANNTLQTLGITALGPHLKKMSNLKHLNVAHNDLRADGAISLSLYVSELKSLQHLVLSYNRFTDKGMNALVPQLCTLPNLQYLNLVHNNISSTGFDLLSTELPQLSSLQALEVGRNDYGLEQLIPQFVHLTSLTQLNLGGTLRDDFSEELVPELLATHLSSLIHLEDLNLWDSGLGKKGMTAVAPALEQLTALQRLNLASNHIGSEGMLALAQHITHLTRLVHLNLALNHIQGEGMKALAQCFTNLTRLQHLNLWMSSIVMEDDSFTRRLSALGSLQHLNLKQSDIGVAEAKLLAQHLSGLASLQHLDLDLNPLQDEGIVALVPALSKLSDLQHLYLQHTGVQAPGIMSLVSCFPSLQCLESLLLGKNNFSDEGAVVLLQHISVLKRLRHLGVSHCDIGSEVYDSMCSLARDLPALKELNIEGNKNPAC